jgi:hypothetical protein
MTIEDAYAEPVAKKRRKDHAFLIGIILGIVAGIIATVMLNRAAEDDPGIDEEPVVELQPAIAPAGDPLARNMASPASEASA